MDENQTIDQDRIKKVNIEVEMKRSYIDYSMSMCATDSSPYTDAYSMVCSALETPATIPTRNVPASLVRCSESTIRTATFLSMVR